MPSLEVSSGGRGIGFTTIEEGATVGRLDVRRGAEQPPQHAATSVWLGVFRRSLPRVCGLGLTPVPMNRD